MCDRMDPDHPGFFISATGQRYKLTLLNSYGPPGRNPTQIVVEFESECTGLLTAYASNIQISFERCRDIFFEKGKNTIMTSFAASSAYNGIALLERLRFSFTPLEEGTDLDYSLERTDRWKCKLVILNEPPKEDCISFYCNGCLMERAHLNRDEYHLNTRDSDKIRFVIGNRFYRIGKN